ncbi:MAG: SsrA-binding protein SmpB [Candidatus Gracilibacteria bacterium]
MKHQKKKSPTSSSLAKNRKALHDFEILDKFEAGIVLNGDEVKSIKAGQINLKGSFVETIKDEVFLKQTHVSPYKHSSRQILDPLRRRKLILHRREIDRIIGTMNEKGVAVFPLEIYLKKGLVKVQIAIGRGKKFYDKRATIKKREQELDIKRALKKYR